MSKQVLEVLTYTLTPQMTADTYLALVATTAPVFAALPGLLSRTLAHQDGT